MLRRNAFLLFVGLLLVIPIVNCGAGSKPVISGTLPNGTAGTLYSGTLTVTHGVAPFTWSITGLPATLTFASSGTTVTISGTPLAAGTISGTATVTDSKGHSSAAFPFSFTIAAAPTPVISGTLPNGNVDVPYSGTLTVTGGVPPFTWNITGLPATLTFAFSGNTVTISGTPLVAATISGTATVTDATQTSSAAFPFTFTIGPVPALIITPASLPQLTVGTATNQVLTVNPATIGSYTWKITAGPSLPPGLSFTGGTSTEPTVIMTTTTNTVTITGTPTTAGTFHIQITVSDSATPPNTTFVNYPVVVVNSNANACPAGSNNAGLAAGTTYAFLLRGFDGAPAQIVIAGSFTVDGKGGITAGDMDSNGFTNGPQEAGTSLDTANSTYSFGLSGATDTRGCLSLVFNTGAAAKPAINGKVQGNTARRFGSTSRRAIRPDASLPPPIPSRIVFQFALGGQTAGIFTTGNIIEFDNVDGSGTSASGVMHVQDPTTFNVSSLAANFAFGLGGWDSPVSRAALAGSFTNAGGTLSPIFADFNNNGTPSGEITGGSGVINTVSTTTGRATASFTVPGVLSAVDAVIYVLNADDFYVLLDDAPTSANTPPLLSGRALATSNTFTAGALNGFSLLASEGFDATNFANDVTIGTAQFSSTGNTATASFTQSDAGTVTTPTFTGTYAVDATNPTSGRVSFTATGTATPPVIYLTSGGDGIEQIQGFSVGTDANVGSGILVTQSATAPAFTAASVSGTYAFGSWEDVDGQNGSFSGSAIFTAPSTYSAVEDETFVTLTAPFLSLGTAVNGTFTLVPAGTGTITVGTNSSVFVTNGVQIFSIAPGTNSSPDAILATYTNVVAP